MSALNQFLSDNSATMMMALLTLIGVALYALLIITWRKGMSKVSPVAEVTIDLSYQIEQLKRAAEHYADVSAVVAMVTQLHELDNDAIERLKSYPETVQAAAWLHYVNVLGSDLQAAQKLLSEAHQGKWHYEGYGSSALVEARKTCQQHVDEVRAKLDAAIRASGRTGLRAV